MLASITPLGERGRRRRWGITVTAYFAAATLAGTAVGALAGAVGALSLAPLLSTAARLGIVAAALAAALLLDARGLAPGPRRQVNEDWLRRYRGWAYGAGFGVQIGSGLATVVTSAAVYAAIVAAAACGSPALGALIGAVSGGLRGATVLAGARVRRPDDLIAFHRRMSAWRAPVVRTSLAAELILLAAATASLLG